MIHRIDHIGIAVRSIEESRRLYEALGLRVEAVEEVASEGVRVALIPCGDTRIELLEATSEDSPIFRFLERRGPGIADFHRETANLLQRHPGDLLDVLVVIDK